MSKSSVGASISLITALTIALMIAPMTVSSAPHGPTDRANGDFLLEWTWQGPSYKLITTTGGNGQTFTRVEMEEYPNSGAPGQPSLPSLGKLVVLPPGGDFGLELVEVVYDTLSLDYPVEPAPAPAPLQFDANGRPMPGGWTFAYDETAYTDAASYPSTFATLDDPAWMRDLRLARLTITPFRYHPAQQTLDVARRMRLRVVPLKAGEWRPAANTAPNDTANRATLNVRNVLNPADVDAFRAPASPAGQLAVPPSPGECKIIVETEGIYALDYAWLEGAGLPMADIDPSTLRLIHDGGEVATEWEGDGDATFEPGERLLFYARPQLTRYANYDVYWITWGGSAGQRVGSRSGDPTGHAPDVAWATVLVEENNEYDSEYAGWDSDHWFWDDLKVVEETVIVSKTFTIPLETPDDGTAGELTVWLQGTTRSWPDPDHHVQFDLNGIAVGDVWWEAKTPYTAIFGLPAGLLSSGANTLTLSLPADTGDYVEGAWVDAITVTYSLNAVSGNMARFRGQGTDGACTIGGFSGVASDDVRVYDVTDPTGPLVVTGWTFSSTAVTVGGNAAAEYLILADDQIQEPLGIKAAKALAEPSGGADYIVITHPDFETALASLIAHRASSGLRVEVVDVEAIYDHFGDGRMDPEAIHTFLTHAYSNWTPPAPLYVLLVGDGTTDPRVYRPDSNLTYLPPYLADVDPWMGETAADHRYADLTGDALPELRLGRLPVNTPGEVEAITNKIISYETDPLVGNWNRRLIFGADNPSDAGDHHADSDSEFNTYTTPAYGYQGTRVYLSEMPGEAHLYTDAQTAQTALIGAFNQGALLYTYFGHASTEQEGLLETDGYAPLFHVTHIAQLNNSRRWPVALHMTCFTGHYVDPTIDTLDESLLKTANVGAVAVWGSSGNGLAPGHNVLHQSFYQSVFDDGQTELGAITNAALADLYPYAGGAYNDLIDTYHLFGDPAMSLNVPEPAGALFLPLVVR